MLSDPAAVLWVSVHVYQLLFKIFGIGHSFPTYREIIGVYFESYTSNARAGDAGTVFRSEFETYALVLWITAHEFLRPVRLKRDWQQYFSRRTYVHMCLTVLTRVIFTCWTIFTHDPPSPTFWLFRLNLSLEAYFSIAFLTIHKVQITKCMRLIVIIFHVSPLCHELPLHVSFTWLFNDA